MTEKISAIAAQIRNRLGSRRPRLAIILGSGLGGLADKIENSVIIPYREIESFPQSTVSGHKGALICGTLAGTEVLCLQGRFHLYEGHHPSVINLVIKVLAALGITGLIVTNAAGSCRPEMGAGSIMLINDHINFSGTNPLIGPNDDSLGPRFPDMSDAYSADWREKIHQLAKHSGINLYDGTYLMVTGPAFDTAAEIRAFQALGADAVGMSTVPEVICAVHSGMKVLGLSVITNLGTGLKNGSQSHAETLAQAEKASAALIRLVTDFVKELN